MGVWDWIIGKPAEASRHAGHPQAARTNAASTNAAGAGTQAATDTETIDAADRWWIPTPEAPAPVADPSAELPLIELPLIELPPIARPEMTAEARALENLLLLHFDGRDLNLPSLPHVPEQVLRLLRKSDCRFTEVANEIGKDPVAAAAVLRMANSALYGGLHKITALEPAVVRLGTIAIRTAMLNLSMRSVTFHEKRAGVRFAEDFWMRAVASATIMRSLSRYTGLDPEEAFLIGLLHDVGNIVVLRITNSQRDRMKLTVDPETFEYLCFESHQEFGELLADAWGLPSRLKALICNHHTCPEPEEQYRLERLQLQVTDTICSLLGFGPYFPVDLSRCRQTVDLKLFAKPDFESFLLGLPDEVEAAIQDS